MHESLPQTNFLKVSAVPEAPCLFVDLRGELDLCSATELLHDDFSSRPDLTTVLVDLGELTFCDGAGLRALLRLRRIHEAQGRSVVVVRVHPFILRLMRICGITDRLEVGHPATAALV